MDGCYNIIEEEGRGMDKRVRLKDICGGCMNEYNKNNDNGLVHVSRLSGCVQYIFIYSQSPVVCK